MRRRLTLIAVAVAMMIPATLILSAAPASATVFSNPSSIALNDPNSQSTGFNNAIATPYPSTIPVSGLSGTINHVAVTLSGVTYSYSQDIDALLVGPGGQKFILVANLGPSGANHAVSNGTLTLSDAGTAPAMTTPWGSNSTFKPVNFGGFNETWPSPAPAPPYADPGTMGTGDTLSSVFDGTNPNGTWSLYVITTAGGDGTGAIAGGWSLDITTANVAATTTALSSNYNPSFTAAPGNSVTLTATVHRTSDNSHVSEGMVAFTDGGTTIAGCGAVAVSAGQATCTTTFTPEGNHTIQAQYGGTASFGPSNATLTEVVNNHTTVTGSNFCNTGSIALNDPNSQSNGNNNATATPYPSNVFVSGLSGTVNHVAVTLNNVSYGHSQDIDALLVGPGGQSLILVANLGPNSGPAAPAANATLTFSDAGMLPPSGQATAWSALGTVKPVNYGGFNEVWGPPAPAGEHGDPGTMGSGATLASQFNGIAGNGTWSLYVVTTAGGDGTGMIAGGWCANITAVAATGSTTTVMSDNNPSFTTAPGNGVTFTATAHKAADNSNISEGTVTFSDGGTPISGCAAVMVVVGTATCTTAFPTQGSHPILAQYNGTANFGPSSGAVIQVVNNHTAVTGNNFCNTGSITLNNPPNTVADATPYPSNVIVTGRPGALQHLAVTLNNVTYSHSQDIDALLVGPGGQTLILVANLGPNSGPQAPASNSTLTLDDAGILPPSGMATPWGSTPVFKPVNFGGFNETWGPPAPPDPYGDPGTTGTGATLSSVFDGTVPNGTWSLYVITTASGDGTGAIAGGWCLGVTSPAAPTLTKTFSAPSVPLNGNTSLSFTVTNPNASTSLSGVGFTDTLPSGLVVSTPDGMSGSCGGGTITGTAGSSSVMLSNATLAGGATCTFSVNVTGTTSGSKVNTTSAVSSAEGGSGAAATATLVVVAPPVLAKAFGAPSVPVGGTTSLTFTVTNPNAGSSLSGVGFTDILPGGLAISNPNGLTGTCGAGTITATAGSSTVSLVGASFGPLPGPTSTCTFAVNVRGTTAGSKVNTTSTVSSSEGGAGAPATATVSVAAGPAQITKSFAVSSIPLDGSTTLSFTISNPAANGTSTGIGFTDSLPAGLVVSTPNGLTGSCGGGTITATAGASTVTLANATLGGGASCTFAVSVTGTNAGVKNNSVTVSSADGGTGNTSNATVTVVAPPNLTKQFGAPSIPLGGTTTLVLTVANPNPSSSLTGVGFTDALPAGLVVATPNGLTGSCDGGTITATAGTANVSLTSTSLGPLPGPTSSCTFAVNVTGTTAGGKVNTTGVVTSAEGGNGAPASATLVVVAAPVIAKSFGASDIPLNGTTTLSFTITNPAVNGGSLEGVGFTDTLPTGLVVSTPNGLTGSCGTITATAGSSTVSLSGATIAPNDSCTFSVNVTGTTAGMKNNSVTVTSTNGGTGNTATASVSVALPPRIAKSFGASDIPLNGTTTLSFTITGPNNFALTGVGFTDTLPSGLVVATPNGLIGSCGGGTITATAGSGTVSLANATLAVGAICTASVNVTGTTAGVKNNSVTVTAGNAGPGNTATASITVVAPPTIAKSFAAASVPFGGNTNLTFTLSNPNAGVALNGVGFTDTLPAGLVVATPNNLTGSCGAGTITASPGSGAVSLSGATLGAGAGCAFSVDVTAVGGGTQNNTTSAVTSAEGGTGGTASASLAVVKAPTITTITAIPTSAGFGAPITFTAVVVPAQPNNSGVGPTGTVSFFLDAQATPIAVVTLVGSRASFTISGLGAGNHTMTAVYSGDANFLGSRATTAASVTVSCTTTITGNHTGTLVLGPGSTCLSGAHIIGSIVVPKGSALDVENSTITGAIVANSPSAFRLCGSTTGGSVTVIGATGFVLIGDAGDDGCAPNSIGGSLTLHNNTHGLEAIANHVAGAVTVSGNSGAGPFPEDTAPDVSGNSH